ncbi:hypothetical protein BJY52DRAFT_1414237 [Lactarius psammicola]|nr:hypothetical protein BJY52DRAFT_1414237 [Lactarius psammicola]
MPDGLFYPMAPANSVPTIIRRYQYQYLPPPSNPTEFTVALRRGLRGANEVGLLGKLKGAGWRFLLKFDKYMHFEIPLRPDFPVAPPGTPRIATPLPDFHISPAISSSFELSPPLPQEEGFLAVPIRTSRGRSADISPSPPARPLPTLPYPPPPYSVLGVKCCQCANGASRPSTNEPLATPDLSTDDIIAALVYADSVFALDDENPNRDGTARPQQRALLDIVSDTVDDTASSDNASEPRGSPITLSNAVIEGIRDAAADTEFLDELGLSANDYRQLLDGVDFTLGPLAVGGVAGRSPSARIAIILSVGGESPRAFGPVLGPSTGIWGHLPGATAQGRDCLQFLSAGTCGQPASALLRSIRLFGYQAHPNLASLGGHA